MTERQVYLERPAGCPFTAAIALLAAAFVGIMTASARAAAPVERLRLPEGFAAEVYAEVEGARTLLPIDEFSAVLVGTRGDAVYAVVDEDRDFRADRVEPLFTGLKAPNGVAWRRGHVYVAEQHRIVRFAGSDLDALKQARPETVYEGLPDKSHHGWRYAGIGPDGRLYAAIGAPCNVCSLDRLEGTIIRLDPEPGGRPEVFADGIRNSVGFDWQPTTGEMYFTDNGADWMGDDRPPDELNRAERPGLHFGFPFYGGGRERTREFAAKEPTQPVTFPVLEFGAHVAALGMRFYRGGMFPEDYRGDAFVAQRGSWNRSEPDGYRVVRVRFGADGRPGGYEHFVEGFFQGGRAWGRPVDVAPLADGSLLISDDGADAVYRITYRGR